MTVFKLDDTNNFFPSVNLADHNGILAVGGDLSNNRLLDAYKNGIFPWYSEGEPILWWSPDPRFVLYPEDLKISKSMRQVLRREQFSITFDCAFEDVINACSDSRKSHEGTWITDEMKEAYISLHKLGFAHSVEAWQDGKLSGGLYGISIGRCFFGESMFTRVSNASKAAFITLVKILEKLNFPIIDCQVYTSHLKSLGASEITRDSFIDIVDIGINYDTIQGSWEKLPEMIL
jgi:leucyl/phenylalanyl-tRNA---protein transferase